MKKIKVTHLITLLELGGAQRNTLYTVSRLNSSRFQCQLLAGPGGWLDREVPDLAARGVEVSFLPSLARPIRPWKDLAALLEIRRALRRFNPQVLHTHSSKAGILGRVAGALAGVPVIIHTFHGFGFNNRQKPWVRAPFVLAEKIAAHLSRKLIVVSEANRREALRLGIGKAEQYALIRSGIRIPPARVGYEGTASLRKALGVPPEAPLITTIGPFKPQKNLTDFVRFCGLVARESPEAFFLLIGDGEARPALEALRRTENLEGRLLMPGWRTDAPELLAASTLFVMTSLWEGLPRALLEAMNLGLVPIAYATDGITDVVRHGVNGLLFAQGDVEGMARAAAGLLRNPERREAFGKAAADSIGAEFDIDRMVRRQEALYEELGGAP